MFLETKEGIQTVKQTQLFDYLTSPTSWYMIHINYTIYTTTPQGKQNENNKTNVFGGRWKMPKSMPFLRTF